MEYTVFHTVCKFAYHMIRTLLKDISTARRVHVQRNCLKRIFQGLSVSDNQSVLYTYFECNLLLWVDFSRECRIFKMIKR